MTAQTATASTVHEPIGKPGGPGLWHHKDLQLPAYIQHVATDLIGQGHDESEAIGMAVGIVKNWAAGSDGHGGRAHPDVQAAAAKAIAEWEALKARAGAGKARRSMAATQRAAMSTADINDLPDSDFAFIKPGGTKDGSGRTIPRDNRMLPIPDAAHVRDALSRLPQSDLSDADMATARAKIAAAAKKFGVDTDDASSSGSASRSEFMRMYPLEDMHILTRAEGDGSGRVVEAYATVFDQPAEIHDGQGHYMEVIDRSAFNQVLQRIAGSRGGLPGAVKVLYNHGKTMEGAPAPEYQLPLGVPLDVRPEKRGLLTRTEYDASDPFTERILSKIKAGSITAQSFVGGIIRSTPELRGPGDRYRGRNGELTTVRRMTLGLREYGPVLFPAYTGAEILGVRMSIPGAADAVLDSPEYEEFVPDVDGDAAGSPPEDGTSVRHHQHQLYRLRSAELRERIGLDW